MFLIQQITDSLTRDLLHPQYKNLRAHPLTGHCYVASEVLYHLWGKQNGYKPACMSHEGSVHWFLRNTITDHVIDITAGQFQTVPDYSRARGCGFLTKQPSKRAQVVFRRMEQHV